MRWIGSELTQGVSLLLEGTLFTPSSRYGPLTCSQLAV